MFNILTFDLGGSSIKYGIISSKGDIIFKDSTPTPKDNFETLLTLMLNILKNLKQFNPVAVSISSPGAVDSISGIIRGVSAIPYIHNFEIKKRFENAFNLPVEIENDGNCSAFAELWLGNGKQFKNIISIVLGSGVGGAIIQNKNLMTGKSFQSGEFGYMLLDKTKTWSSLCSTTALVDKAKEITQIDSLDGKKLFNMISTKDESLEVLFEDYYFNLFKGIYNLQCAFDTDTIIIGGGISSNKIFFDNLLKYIDKFYNSLEIKVEKPFIQKAYFENDSNLIGAAYNYLKNI